MSLKCNALCNQVNPALERRVTAKLVELAMDEHEGFLSDLVCFVDIASKRQRPPEDHLVKRADEAGERCDIAKSGVMNKLGYAHLGQGSLTLISWRR